MCERARLCLHLRPCLCDAWRVARGARRTASASSSGGSSTRWSFSTGARPPVCGAPLRGRPGREPQRVCARCRLTPPPDWFAQRLVCPQAGEHRGQGVLRAALRVAGLRLLPEEPDHALHLRHLCGHRLHCLCHGVRTSIPLHCPPPPPVAHCLGLAGVCTSSLFSRARALSPFHTHCLPLSLPRPRSRSLADSGCVLLALAVLARARASIPVRLSVHSLWRRARVGHIVLPQDQRLLARGPLRRRVLRQSCFRPWVPCPYTLKPSAPYAQHSAPHTLHLRPCALQPKS